MITLVGGGKKKLKNYILISFFCSDIRFCIFHGRHTMLFEPTAFHHFLLRKTKSFVLTPTTGRLPAKTLIFVC